MYEQTKLSPTLEYNSYNKSYIIHNLGVLETTVIGIPRDDLKRVRDMIDIELDKVDTLAKTYLSTNSNKEEYNNGNIEV